MNDKIIKLQSETALKIISLVDCNQVTLGDLERIVKDHDAAMQALLMR